MAERGSMSASQITLVDDLEANRLDGTEIIENEKTPQQEAEFRIATHCLVISGTLSSLSIPPIIWALVYSFDHPRGTKALPLLVAVFCGWLLSLSIVTTAKICHRPAFWKTLLVVLYLYGCGMGLMIFGASIQQNFKIL